MKKIRLLFVSMALCLSAFAQENDPVILTIEGENTHASEFLAIYSKNNENPSFHKDSLDNYIKLFTNYKLKVQAAKEAKYDTIPRLKAELAQYRKQLAFPYMTDKSRNEALVKEAYERTITEVRASHILIRVQPDAAPADTLKAYNRALELRERIVTNGETFEDVARGKNGSDDQSVSKNGGDLGYFSAMQMVYPFENAAYNTPVGEVSMPVRTRFGYHLIHVVDKRKAMGMIETAHILILVNDESSKEAQANAETKINEIYNLLEAGERFEELAAKYSDDQSSKAKGGLLPMFGSGSKQRMVPKFEEAAFAIEKDGEYTKPVKTMFGYHIIKRIQLLPIPSFEAMKRELELKVERDMRAETTHEAFINDLKKEYYLNKNAAQKLLPIFIHTVGDEIFMAKWRGLRDHSHDNDILYTFADQSYTIKDFEEYLLETQTKSRQIDKSIYFNNKLDEMINKTIIEYEDSQLERKHPKFKALINEYSDGILVFEIMQDEIWKKASKDTVGIKAYYEANREDFTYPIRYKGNLFTCKDKATAKAVVSLLEEGKLSGKEIEQTMNKESQLNVKMVKQTFNANTTEAFKVRKSIPPIQVENEQNLDEKAKAKLAAKRAKRKEKLAKYKLKSFKNGINKPYKNGEVYYVFDVEETLEPRLREFNEAKGLVTAAYQNQLEEEWIAALRDKYEVVIHHDNLYNLKNTSK
ncbi:peptidylprolyl isomerase [Crocinitomix algicola]|uniref:peptidylprolyl isomerase n=1 Tax=Crocinitomix algicola TaxID=1740263 RepID=UPI00082EDF94|nr:peptidylprolyl isomerase [Crocinitomix algicola]